MFNSHFHSTEVMLKKEGVTGMFLIIYVSNKNAP